MLFSSHELNDQFRPKDEITEHTLNILRLVHCGKHSYDLSLVSKKSSLVSKKYCLIWQTESKGEREHPLYKNKLVLLGDSKDCLQLKETDTLKKPIWLLWKQAVSPQIMRVLTNANQNIDLFCFKLPSRSNVNNLRIAQKRSVRVHLYFRFAI